MHNETGPWNAVLFSGDLVYSGLKDQYEKMTRSVILPLFKKIDELQPGIVPALLTVPGNHDLERPKMTAAVRMLIDPDGLNSEVIDKIWRQNDCEYRAVINQAFKNYSDWELKPEIKTLVPCDIKRGVLPGDFVVTLTVGALKIGIVGLNSTFLQLGAGECKGRLQVSQQQIAEVCDNDVAHWARNHDACILMTHQGLDWLREEIQNNEYPEINPAGRFAVHLFGHTHETVAFTSTLGGGYPRRLWQTRSLAGVDNNVDPNSRRHGYSNGKIERNGNELTIRCWPRQANFIGQNGWNFGADTNFANLEDDNGTRPETVTENRPPNSSKKQNQDHIAPSDLLESNKVAFIIAAEMVIAALSHYSNDTLTSGLEKQLRELASLAPVIGVPVPLEIKTIPYPFDIPARPFLQNKFEGTLALTYPDGGIINAKASHVSGIELLIESKAEAIVCLKQWLVFVQSGSNV